MVCNDNDVKCENGLRIIKKETRVYIKWYSSNLKYNLPLNISSVHDAVVVILVKYEILQIITTSMFYTKWRVRNQNIMAYIRKNLK